MPPQDNDGVKFRTYKSTGSVGMPVNSGRHCHADIRHMQTCNLWHHPKPLDADIYPQQCKCRKQCTYKHNQNGCPSSCATFRKSPLMCNWPSCCWCIWSDCHLQCRHQSRSPFPTCSIFVITHCHIRQNTNTHAPASAKCGHSSARVVATTSKGWWKVPSGPGGRLDHQALEPLSNLLQEFN